jgi:uncharacterized membrane protein YgcG
MKFIKLSATILAGSLLLTACNTGQTDEAIYQNPYPNDAAVADQPLDVNDYFAKDNFDLQRVGNLLERADNPAELEYLLNNEDGINNLDLNGDGYSDYIGVREFEDRGRDERGLSLFSRFGPDLIQEIATIFFDRDGGDYPGARILLDGNDQIYGDDYYYETNWLDRSLPLVSYLFTDRNNYYNSPYYYENYPADYEPFRIVETTVYRTRIEQYYPQPVFVYTTAPTFIDEIEIRSPYEGRYANIVTARLAKPTREQIEYRRNNPPGPPMVPPGLAKKDLNSKPGKGPKGITNDFDQSSYEKNEKPAKNERPEKAERNNGNFDKAERFNNRPDKAERVNDRPNRAERINDRQNRVERVNERLNRVERVNERPNRVERVNNRPEPVRNNQPNRVERINNQPKPARMERPNMKQDRPQNPGGGGGKVNGGGKPDGGGGNGKGNAGGGGGGKGGGKKN